MSLRELPARPDLEHLKKQAKLLQHEALEASAAAIERFRQAQVTYSSGAPKLADAQHVIAREYGFDNWTKLKIHVSALSDDPMEALTVAIKANDAALAREVLDRYRGLGTRLNEPLPNYSFDTPALIAAVYKNNRELIDLLLRAGADINARTRWWAGGFGVLDNSSPELTPYLIERGAVVDIHAAARLGMFDRVRSLIEADSNLVHARGGDGQTPLHFASSIEIAGYLLDHGAEIDARDIDHESTAAQYMAAHWPRRPDVARYLISRGAQTDILMAAAVGDLERVRHHLDEDPDSARISVSEKDFPKQNPESGGCIYIFGFGWTRTAHMLAHQFGHLDVFHLLMTRSSLALRFAIACEIGDHDLANRLLEKHSSLVGKMRPEAYRRIIGAALRNNTRAVDMMLGAGWPTAVTGSYDQTALHWAAFHGNAEMVRALLKHEAPLEAQEQQYKATPLGWALYGSVNGWLRDAGDYPLTVQVLLEAGAKTHGPADELTGTDEVLEVVRRFQA
ncbi:MAG: ankyrin repeat domain-containing protein [Acidobacteriaceae bacterium]